MRTINSSQSVKIPKGVSAKVNARVITIRGPRGKLTRDFRHLAMDVYLKNRKKLVVEKWFGTKKEIAAVRTVCSHIENMIKGKLIGKSLENTSRSSRIFKEFLETRINPTPCKTSKKTHIFVVKKI